VKVKEPEPANVPDWSKEPASDRLLDPYVLARIVREARQHELLPKVRDL
jgi:hypothetical protein